MAGEKILLVEYDPRTLKETKDLLMRAGFRVHEAADGLSALSLFEELKPDLVLMSPMLPKVHGFDVCQRIKSNPSGKNTPVIIISDVYKGKRYRIDAIHHYKADDFVEKPISEGDLVKLLLNAINKYKKAKAEETPQAPEPKAETKAKVKARTEELKSDATLKITAEEVAGTKEVIIGEKDIEKKEPTVIAKPAAAPRKTEISIDSLLPPMELAPKAEAKESTQKAKKPGLDSDMEKKLADTLSGLEIGRPSKPKPKAPEVPKPAIPTEKAPPIIEKEKILSKPESVKPAVDKTVSTISLAPEKAESAETFTSEQLFEDVIESVEQEAKEKTDRELELPELEVKEQARLAEKKQEHKTKKLHDTAVGEKEKKSKEAYESALKESKAAVETPKKAPAKAAGAEDDIEKKLSDTLAGLSKEFGLKAPPPKETVKEKVPRIEVPVQEPTILETAPPLVAPLKDISRQPASSKRAVPSEELLEALEEEVSTEGLIYGSYILLEKIATGGMAELFKAKKKGVEGFEKVLAIKRILPHLSDNEEFVKMFVDEAKLAAQLTHPSIVQIYELGKVDSSLFIAMELVEGKDARSILKKTKQLNMPVPIPLSIYIASKLCSALDYAHRMKNQQGDLMNIVHRDVSPQNILVSFEGEVKLVDFGIAKAAVKAHQTQIGALKGKLLYMSPEQASAKHVDKRSDIFALGIVLWEMIANRSLFYEKGDSEVSIIDKVRDAIIPDIKKYRPTIPLELQAILLKALTKEASNRYQDASEMLTDLDNLLHHLRIQVTQSTISRYISALFADNLDVLSEMEKQMELPLAETVVVTPKKKVEEPVHKPLSSTPATEKSPVPAIIEQVPEHLQKTPAQEASAKPFPRLDMYGVEKPTAEKKNYLTYIIPAVIGLAIIGVLIGIFRPKGGTQDKTQQLPITTTQTAQNNVPAPIPVPPKGNQLPATTTKPDSKTAKKEIKPDQTKEEKTAVKEEEKKPQETVEPPIEKKESPTITPAETTKLPVDPPKKEESKIIPVEPPPTKSTTTPETIPLPEEKPKEEPVKIVQNQQPPPPPTNPPAEEKINEGDLVTQGADVVIPQAIKKIIPSYPLAAKRQGIEGLVILQALISEKGDVLTVKPLRGNDMLSTAAMDAVRQWKFEPATKKGVRVKIWYTITIPFKIK